MTKKREKLTLRLFVMRWFVNWATLATGLTGVISLGLWRPFWEARAIGCYLRAYGSVKKREASDAD